MTPAFFCAIRFISKLHKSDPQKELAGAREPAGVSMRLEYVYAKCPHCVAYVCLDIALRPERIGEMRPVLEKIPARCSLCHHEVPNGSRELLPRTNINGLTVDREIHS